MPSVFLLLLLLADMLLWKLWRSRGLSIVPQLHKVGWLRLPCDILRDKQIWHTYSVSCCYWESGLTMCPVLSFEYECAVNILVTGTNRTLRNRHEIISNKHTHTWPYRDAKSLPKRLKQEIWRHSKLHPEAPLWPNGGARAHRYTRAYKYKYTHIRTHIWKFYWKLHNYPGQTWHIGRTKTKNIVTFWCFARRSLRNFKKLGWTEFELQNVWSDRK